jgi:hypothetical protein
MKNELHQNYLMACRYSGKMFAVTDIIKIDLSKEIL